MPSYREHRHTPRILTTARRRGAEKSHDVPRSEQDMPSAFVQLTNTMKDTRMPPRVQSLDPENAGRRKQWKIHHPQRRRIDCLPYKKKGTTTNYGVFLAECRRLRVRKGVDHLEVNLGTSPSTKMG